MIRAFFKYDLLLPRFKNTVTNYSKRLEGQVSYEILYLSILMLSRMVLITGEDEG